MQTYLKILKYISLLGALSLFLFGVTAWLIHRPTPKAEADGTLLASRIEQAVNISAWKETGLIQWSFAGATHLWDRKRKLHQYKRGNLIIQHHLETRKAIRLQDNMARKATPKEQKKAWDMWINDSFWLNPLAKFRDAGVVLSTVTYEREQTLLVHHTQGGNTPGDHYLWFIDENSRPYQWRMWVSIIPIGGIACSWENWIQLPTKAWIAQSHQCGPLEITLTNIKASYSWQDLFETDPFETLITF